LHKLCKVLLAFHEAWALDKVLAKGLTRYTENTVTNPDVLKKQLAEIRETGFCYSECEYLPGIVSFGAPIRDYSNVVVAAVSLVGPLNRMKHQPFAALKNKVMRTAKEISRNLGYFGK
jgi:IclR family KDG regulon transcriptional repressor